MARPQEAGPRGQAPAVVIVVLAAVLVTGLVAVLPGAAADLLIVAVLAAAGTAAALRAQRCTPAIRPLFVLLAMAWTVQAAVALVGAVRGGAGGAALVDAAHLASVPFLLAALIVAPCLGRDRRGGMRRQAFVDVAVSGIALALIALQVVWSIARAGALDIAWASSARTVTAVLVSTAVVWLLSATADPGALRTRVIWSVAAAACLSVLADAGAALQQQLGARTTGQAITVLASAALVLAVLHSRGDGDDPPPLLVRRRQVAILAPTVPLIGAAFVLAALSVQGTALPPSLLAISVGLLVVLMVSTVLARLDALDVTHNLEERVAQRTLDLGSREQWFRALVQNSSDVISVVDVDGVIRFQTASMHRVLGHDPALMVGSPLSGLLRPADDARLRGAFAEAARHPQRTVVLTFPVWHRDGRWCHTETTVTSLVDDPAIGGFVLNMRDVSERQRLEEELTRQAFSDPLTGLANRALFRERVEGALDGAGGAAAGTVAVVFLDLDGFKAVNDSQGHAVGDTLLELVGQRLRNCVRPGDLVARLGGDEFAVLVIGEQAESGAVWASDRIRRVLAGDFVLDRTSVTIGASLGIAVNDTGEETADQLLRNADLAMYRAKASARADVLRFEASMHQDLVARVDAENDLRRAIDRGDLRLYYQPLVDLRTGLVVGAEALVRWQHPERGVVPPEDFIGLAEETGLVEQLGTWAIAEAARTAARWQHLGPDGSAFRVGVNVSGRQVTSSLPRLVRDVLAETGLPPGALTLEMTESVLMDRPEQASVILKRLKSLGVRIAVDDFGTGYSSLSYLARFPVDALKIDRSFIEHVVGETEQTELVRTIVRLGQSLGLVTVAEGIEREDQRDVVAGMGCTLGQGFLFSRALPADEFVDHVARFSLGMGVR